MYYGSISSVYVKFLKHNLKGSHVRHVCDCLLVIHIEFFDMFMMHPQNKFYRPRPNDSLVMAKAKYKFHTSAIFLQLLTFGTLFIKLFFI
jgi:hypothetical protein